MGRLLIMVFVIGGVGILAGLLLLRQLRSFRRGVDYRQIVMDETVQRNARKNYVLLEQSIGVIERLLAADETYTLFSSARQREEAEALVRKFNQDQLDK